MQDKLLSLLQNSYSPYSKFRVACIILMKDGKEYTGINVENASYGASICAERVAILKAVSDGYRKKDFKELHVMCDSHKISSCCFMCRQVISEFFEDNASIILYNNSGDTKEYSVSELCPVPFSEDDLK